MSQPVSAAEDALPQLPSMHEQGRMPQPYGQPSAYVKEIVRIPVPATASNPSAWFTPLQDLHGNITPNGLHFVRTHAGVPEIDPRTFRLLVHGLVERPLVFTVDDLVRFPVSLAPPLPGMFRQYV